LRKRVRGLDEGTHSSIPKSVFKMYVATAGKCPRYILNRGITLKEAKQWRIGYDSKEYRATFPVWDHMGELVGITGRAIYPNAVAKYRMYHGFDARKYLYGEHKLDVTRRSCILVEGQIDAIVLSRYYPNVMAVLGLSMTQERVTKLKAWFEDVTLMLDNDAAGRGAAQRFQKDVHGVVRLFAAWLPEKVDPKAATYEQLKEAMSKRKLVGLSL
jgi:DNA primase